MYFWRGKIIKKCKNYKICIQIRIKAKKFVLLKAVKSADIPKNRLKKGNDSGRVEAVGKALYNTPYEKRRI